MMQPDPPETATPERSTVAPAAKPVGAAESEAAIARALSAFRARARWMLVGQRAGWIIGAAIAAVAVGAILDYFLRSPGWLRTGGLCGAAVLLGAAVARLLLPVLRFSPSLTEVALRIERSESGRRAGLQGVLASGLELGRNPGSLPAPVLAEPVVHDAAARLGRIRAGEVFTPGRTVRGVGIGTIALGTLVLCMGAAPDLTRTGLSRMLLPWGGAEWPKRTGVVDATAERVHPLGSAVALRAAVTRSDGPVDRTRVTARYRVITAGVPGPQHTALLNSQQRETVVESPGASGERLTGRLFELLVEPTGAARNDGRGTLRDENSARGAAVRTELEYSFETSDDRTPPVRMLLVEPPAVRSATLKVVAPEYAARLLGESSPGGAATIDMGPGSDERAAPAPILAGSRVTLTIALNKPVPTPTGEAALPATIAWMSGALGPDMAALVREQAEAPGAGPVFNASQDGTWTLSWTMTRSVRLSLKPTDEFGIAPAEESVYRLDVLRDEPPTATVTAPAEDRSVLPTAIVELSGEGRDDVALKWVGLDRQIARKTRGSEGGQVEPVDAPAAVVRVDAVAAETPAPTHTGAAPASPSPVPGGVKRLTATAMLDLSTMDVQAGDEVWITAIAADAFDLDGATHPPARSTVRKLRILSRDQLVEQIWTDLSGVRRSAIKIDQDQSEVAKGAAQPGEDAAARTERAQAGLTERLSRQAEALRRLQQRISENGLSDAALSDVLRQSGEMLKRAGEQSAKASTAMGEASRAESQESAPKDAGAKEREQASQAQAGVRDELSDLIDLLDQGEDTFAAKRSIERVLEQQKALRDQTQQTGKQTTGKSGDQLSTQEQHALEQIGEQQDSLAEQVREAVKKMQERQEKVRKTDPAAAQAMEQTARRAQREQVAEKMERAAQQSRSNQTNNAQQQQAQAIQSLEQMLSDLDKANENRDEVLRRFLASLIDSLQTLIAQQKTALGALQNGAQTGDLHGLDIPMARLHQDTLGVLDQLREAPREAAPIARLVGDAGDEQQGAVVDLRAAPPRADEAETHEEASLKSLSEALELAQKLDQGAGERQASRDRAELRKKYEAALKQQLSLKDGSEGLVGVEPTRRTRAQARLVGQDQAALKETLQQIRTQTKELNDAKVFDFAHRRIDELMTTASGKLLEGEADRSVVLTQTAAIRVLKSLVDSLNDRKKHDDPFRKNEGGGGGGGGSGGQQQVVPPAAEIALLRAMQQEAADLTQTAGDAPKPDAAVLEMAGKLQRDISSEGQALLQRLAEKSKGGNIKPGGKPGTEPGGKPDDKPDHPDDGVPGDAPKEPAGAGGAG